MLVRMAALRRRASGDGGWFLGEELIVGRDEANHLVSVPLGV